jgi:hypothetical protein
MATVSAAAIAIVSTRVSGRLVARKENLYAYPYSPGELARPRH